MPLTKTAVAIAATLAVGASAVATPVASAAPAAAPAAPTRAQAERAALTALRARSGSRPLIVFRGGLLRPGTRVAAAGQLRLPAPRAASAASRSRERLLRAAEVQVVRAPPVVTVRRERAWFFYADEAPFQAYQHPGRVVLVGAASGRVTISRTLQWPPLLNGRLPWFLRSYAGYRAPRARLFARLWRVGRATARAADPLTPASELLPPAGAQATAAQLAAERSCVVRVGDTLGNFYDASAFDQTRAGVGDFFNQLAQLDGGFVSARYRVASGSSLRRWVARLIAERGCRDVLLYLAGGGYVNGGEPAVSVGIQGRADGRLEQQAIGATLLRSIVADHPSVTFKLQLDAPGSGALLARLDDLPNLLLFLASSKRGGPSFTALPDLAARGGTLHNDYNSAGLLEFSNRGLRGLRCFVADPAEVAAAAADKAAGRSRSFLAAMLWRAYQLCGEGSLLDVVAPDGPAPVARLVTPAPAPPAPPAPVPPPPAPPTPPTNSAPTAAPVAVATDEDAPVSFTLAGADADGDPLTYALVAQPANGTVSGGDGAARSFTPAPDWNGETSFDYRVSDGRGGSATATVTIAVAPVADRPLVDAGSGTLRWIEGDGPLALAPALTLSEADGDEIDSATVAISAGLDGGADLLAATPAAPIVAAWDAATGTLRLSGRATVAAYQAALRTVTYASTSSRPSEAPRTIAFTAVDSGGDSAAPVTRALTVVAVNSAPTLTGLSATPLAFTEGDAPIALAPTAAIDDADDARLAGVTVAIGAGYQPGEDELDATDSAHVTGSWDAVAGVLRLGGDATPAEYETALRDVVYRNDSEDPSGAPRTLTISVDDGSGGTVASQLQLTVTPVDDPPVIAVGNDATAFTGEAVAVAPDLTVSDADDATLTGATVRIAGGHIAADVLAATDAHGIVSAYDGSTGVLTLAGTASLADYQAVLRGVTFDGDPLVGGMRTITFAVANGASSNTVTKTVTLSAAPVVTLPGGGLAYSEGDGARAVDAGATVSDGDSADLVSGSVTITSGYEAGDTLAADTSGTPIAASYDPVAHTLQLSGAATVADWQSVLRRVTFRNDSATISTAPRTLAFVVSDGTMQSSPATTTVTVTAVDSPPVVTTSAGASSYTEDAAAVVVDGGLTVTDADSAVLRGASVSLGTVLGGDELQFTNQNGISGSYDSGTGVLTLTGDATVAAYQAALRSVRFRAVGDAPAAVTRTVAFAATDGTSYGTPATKEVAVTPVDDAPVVSSAATLAYSENDPATAIDPALTVSDPDSARLAGATVVVSSGFVSGEDTLLYVNSASISGVWNTATGALTLTGDATVADYQAALRSIRYRNDSENPSTADRTIRFTVSDGSLTGSDEATVTVTAVDDAPTAAAVSTDTVGNTRLAYGSSRPSGRAARVVSGRSVLEGVTDVDSAGPFAAVAETVASVNGGSATIAADGSFDYTPPTGFAGTDTFAYRVAATSAPSVTGSGVVTVTVSGMVWYVDNSAPAGGAGASQEPFDTLAEATAASAAGDTIYLFAGDGTTTGTGAPVALKNGQRLLGERAPLAVGGTSLYDGDSSARPQIAGAVTHRDGDVVRGLRLFGGISASAAAGGTLDDLVVAASGGDAIRLSLVSGSWRLSDLDVSNSAGNGIAVLNSNATVDFDSASAIRVSADGGGYALQILRGTTSGQIDSLTTTGTSGTAAAVSVLNTSGALTLDDLSLRTAGTEGTGLLLDDSAGVVVNASGDAAIDAAGQAVALRTSGSAPAAKVQPRVALSSVRSAGGAYGVELNDVGDATFSAAGGSLTGQTSAAFQTLGANGDVTYGGTIRDGSGDSVQIVNRSGGAVRFNGTISDGTDAGGGIVTAGVSGGSISFTAPGPILSTGTSAAVDLGLTGPASVSFSGGGMQLSTTSGDAFRATSPSDNGVVSVSGENNGAAASAGGAALRLDRADIGTNGVRFQRLISSGAVSGIVLRNTGSAGGLVVSGTGAVGSGGTLANSVGPGIDLLNARTIALSDLTVSGGGDDGIRAQGVSDMTLTRLAVTGNGNATGESNLELSDPRGTIALDDLTVSGAAYRGLQVTSGGGSAAIAIDGGSWGGSTGAAADDTINVDGSGTANVTLTIDGIRATAAAGDHLQVTSDGSAQSRLTASVTDSTFENAPGGPGGGLTFNPGGSATLRALLSGNTITGAALEAITIATPGGDASPQPVTIDATIDANAIGRSGVAGSGASNGNGIGVRATGGATVRAAVTGNQIRQYGNTSGIRLLQSDGGGALHATVTGNTLAEPSGANALYGLYATAGSGDGSDDGLLCLDLRLNAMTGAGQTALGGFDAYVRRRDQTTVRLPGYAGGAADTSAVGAFLAANNPPSPATSAAGSGGGSFSGGAACAAPQ